jgi:hypothetical protein
VNNSLTYRLFQPSDVPGLLRLWEEHSGWGAITEEQWRQWFLDTPHGPCLVVVALDDQGELVGQEVFTPANLEVAGKKLKALRISAPILQNNLRRSSLRDRSHPVIQMLLAGQDAARSSGFDVIYGMPEHAWLPIFRWMPQVGLPHFDQAEYVCMTLQMTDEVVSKMNRISDEHEFESRLPVFGDEYDELWKQAKRSFPVDCAIIRDPTWVKFRNGGRITTEIRHRETGDLIGYVAFKKQNHLLADILARTPEDLIPVLATAIHSLPTLSNNRDSTVRAMATPVLRPVLSELGFESTEYQFAFVCNSLHEEVSNASVAPDRWYVTPGD